MRGARAGGEEEGLGSRSVTPKLTFFPAHHSAPGTRPAYPECSKGRKRHRRPHQGGDPAQKVGKTATVTARYTAASSHQPQGPGPPRNRLPFCPHTNENPTAREITEEREGIDTERTEQDRDTVWAERKNDSKAGHTRAAARRLSNGVYTLPGRAVRKCVCLRGNVTALFCKQRQYLCFVGSTVVFYTQPHLAGLLSLRCKLPGSWGRGAWGGRGRGANVLPGHTQADTAGRDGCCPPCCLATQYPSRKSCSLAGSQKQAGLVEHGAGNGEIIMVLFQLLTITLPAFLQTSTGPEGPQSPAPEWGWKKPRALKVPPSQPRK